MTTNQTNMNTETKLPTTLSEIKQCAASMFQDEAVVSLDVTTSWGMARVYPNGEVIYIRGF